MIVENEPYLIEYNVRMGDPECQTILPRLKTDFLDLITATINEDLESTDLEWYDKKSLCIVLCSKGYPDKFNLGFWKFLPLIMVMEMMNGFKKR